MLEDEKQTVMASKTERFFHDKFAPMLVNSKLKIVILILYLLWTMICIYGCYQLESWYDLDEPVNEYFKSHDYILARDKYF